MRRICLLLLLTAAAMISLPARAQSFKVDSFRMLVNDVTAFIDPVNDLNDEGCALIKVVASPDFEFSTPLGIVKRVENIGEIWIYLPKGSKKITIKHPEWGVLRDYNFPEKLRSHVSYELCLKGPGKEAGTKLAMVPQVTTVHDTLLVVRTDTLVIPTAPRRYPLSIDALATFSLGGRSRTGMGGVMLTLMRRSGAYVHLQSDFGSIGKTIGECDRAGYVAGKLPYYTGATRHSAFIATAGAIQRVSDSLRIFGGLGYGSDIAAWELSQASGGGFVRNSHYSKSGVSFEAGVAFTLRRVVFSASAVTIEGRQWYGSIGVGVRIK